MWSSVLDDVSREAADAAVSGIDADLMLLTAEVGNDQQVQLDRLSAPGLAGPGLASGLSALALYNVYRAAALSTSTASAALIRHAQTLMETWHPPLGLFDGAVGVAWVAEQWRRSQSEYADGDPNDEFDLALLELLDVDEWRGRYDLADGLAGIGLYCMERLPSVTARACLESVLRHVDKAAQHSAHGVHWPTRPPRGSSDRSAIDLGVAHGQAGVVGFLARLFASGFDRQASGSLLERGVRWLFAQAIDGSTPLTFPRSTARDEREQRVRPAWCYGDPGIALVLLSAGRATGCESWVEEAVRTIRAVPNCSQGTRALVRDPGLCHGASGIAMIYHDFFTATGDESLCRRAREWYWSALQMRRSRGVGGYCSLTVADDGRAKWRADASLMTGAIGVALALRAGTNTASSDWRRLLLLGVDDAACGHTVAPRA